MAVTAKYHRLMVPGNRLLVVYRADDGEISERIITVYRTSMQGLVFAHCERRNAIRTFDEARILWADYADSGTQVETFAAMQNREEAERWAAVDAMRAAAVAA
jgi:predicted DNA-binding transcriptional regulator YafY